MYCAKYIVGCLVFTTIATLQPCSAQGDDVSALWKRIEQNAARNKARFTGGEFEYRNTSVHLAKGTREAITVYYAFQGDKSYYQRTSMPNSYVVKNDLLYTVDREPSQADPRKLIKCVNFSRMDWPNAIKAHGLLIGNQDVVDALPGFTNPKPGKDPKWGAFVQVEAASEFKGDKIRDWYSISEEGLVFRHEEEIVRGAERYRIRTRLLEVEKRGEVIIPVRSVLEKVAIENGKERPLRSREYQVTKIRLGKVADPLFVVTQEPGDRFQDGATGKSTTITAGNTARRSYLPVLAGVGLLGLLCVPAWWARQRFTR